MTNYMRFARWTELKGKTDTPILNFVEQAQNQPYRLCWQRRKLSIESRDRLERATRRLANIKLDQRVFVLEDAI